MERYLLLVSVDNTDFIEYSDYVEFRILFYSSDVSERLVDKRERISIFSSDFIKATIVDIEP